MTRKEFYLDLGKYLFEEVNQKLTTPIRHFDLWNDQTGPDWKKPFPTPAIFLEYHQTHWRSLSKNVQRGKSSFNLHIVSKVSSATDYLSTLRDNNLQHLDLIDELHYHLTGFSGDYFTPLVRIESFQDHFFDELIKHIETYKCTFEDTSAVRPTKPAAGDILEIK